MSKVDLDKPCLEWEGAKDFGGYGKKTVKGKSCAVHRLEWEKRKGPIPDEKSILHHCDHPPCYEITHLFLGTQSDNMKDMYKKNRESNKGSHNPRAKLSEKDIIIIKDLLKTEPPPEIADAFEVSRSTIYAIKSGQNWR